MLGVGIGWAEELQFAAQVRPRSDIVEIVRVPYRPNSVGAKIAQIAQIAQIATTVPDATEVRAVNVIHHET
jgi:tRNA (Thr-GGU) A37 N-methylase